MCKDLSGPGDDLCSEETAGLPLREASKDDAETTKSGGKQPAKVGALRRPPWTSHGPCLRAERGKPGREACTGRRQGPTRPRGQLVRPAGRRIPSRVACGMNRLDGSGGLRHPREALAIKSA